MTQAIRVKYLKPTANHGARLKAECRATSGPNRAAKPLVEAYDYGDPDQQAAALAHKLADQLGWRVTTLAGGTLPDGQTWVFVSVWFTYDKEA